jgi:hypothetical protein
VYAAAWCDLARGKLHLLLPIAGVIAAAFISYLYFFYFLNKRKENPFRTINQFPIYISN